MIEQVQQRLQLIKVIAIIFPEAQGLTSEIIKKIQQKKGRTNWRNAALRQQIFLQQRAVVPQTVGDKKGETL